MSNVYNLFYLNFNIRLGNSDINIFVLDLVTLVHLARKNLFYILFKFRLLKFINFIVYYLPFPMYERTQRKPI